MFKKKIAVKETIKDQEIIVDPKTLPIAEKNFEDINVIAIRFTGRYSEIGDYVAILMKTAGIKKKGTPFCIFHKGRAAEINEINDIEVCVPVSGKMKKPDIEYKTIKGGKFLTTIQAGAYKELYKGFEALEEYAKENNIVIQHEAREYYIKGPELFVKKYPNRFSTALCYKIEN